MSPLSAILALPLLAAFAAAMPAEKTAAAPSSATPPAVTQGPSMSDASDGLIITPTITFGFTTISGQAYPVVGGSAAGGYRFSGSQYYLTGYLGGYLYNCYNQINSGGKTKVLPALCFGGDELDTEVIGLGSLTLYDGGRPGDSTDLVASGKFPGPLSASGAGVVGIVGTAVVGGAFSGLLNPALNSGDTANGGLGGAGSVTLGPVSFGGQAGGSFVTKVSYTSFGGGAVGSLYVGPLGGAGTIGGEVVGKTDVGCLGLNVAGVGYTGCVTATS